LGIQRDAVSARPQAFVVADKDGWFIFNLVNNLAHLESATAPKVRTQRSSRVSKSDNVSIAAMKKCPDCAEMVLADARLCRFCRHVFGDSSAESGATP